MLTLREMSDRMGIQDLLVRHAHAADTRDRPLFRELFTADAVLPLFTATQDLVCGLWYRGTLRRSPAGRGGSGYDKVGRGPWPRPTVRATYLRPPKSERVRRLSGASRTIRAPRLGRASVEACPRGVSSLMRPTASATSTCGSAGAPSTAR